jgi:porin
VRRRGKGSAVAWLVVSALGADPLSTALCQENDQQPIASPDARSTSSAVRRARSPLFDRETLGGDWGGIRPALGEFGTQLAVTYTGEVFDVARGGLRRGASYDGLLAVDLDTDLGTALGWTGAAFHATAYQIHGEGVTSSRVGNLMTISDIEATRATRLSTLWLEQSFLSGALSVRLGQLAADDEFLISQYAIPLPNGTFGWPEITGANLPSGGPAYPLATPGIRVKATPTAALSFMVGVFNGDPAGPGVGDPQRRDPSGTAFRFNDNVLAIGEAAYAINQGERALGLPGTYKLGGWFHGGRFPDQRLDSAGLSLADPASSGAPASHRSNFGAYAVVDQALWRRPGGSGDQGVGLFFRVAGSPGDRNLVDVYADAGLTVKGPLPDRDDDLASIGFAYTRISRSARGLDRDAAAFSGTDRPVRDFEALLDLTYQLQIAPWVVVQPDMQVVFHPGGNAADPNDRSGVRPIRDALVFGFRTVLRL